MKTKRARSSILQAAATCRKTKGKIETKKSSTLPDGKTSTEESKQNWVYRKEKKINNQDLICNEIYYSMQG